MSLGFLRRVFEECRDSDAFVWNDRAYSYGWLQDAIAAAHAAFDAAGVGRGAAVMLYGSQSPGLVAAFLSLLERGAIAILVSSHEERHGERFAAIAAATHDVRVGGEGAIEIDARPEAAVPELYGELRERSSAGIVLFSSGSTGEPKGVVHDAGRLLVKYQTRRHCLRTLAFLLFDHIGGLDTTLYSLSNGSCLVMVDDRSPESVCRAIAAHRVEVLPTAPSFLKLLHISGAAARYDLSSIKIVTYGAETMPDSTLRTCAEMFPHARLMQKYGTSEVGTLRSQSRDDGSLWVRIGGEGYETRVREGKLEIRAESSMLGYLNAESPFTDDGWFMTGDAVDVEGEFIRFLGRESDLINVGGQKVYPAEVENVVAAVEGVVEAAVHGEEHSLLGEIVCARVRAREGEDERFLQRRIRAACREALDKYKVPSKITFSETALSTERGKLRRGAD